MGGSRELDPQELAVTGDSTGGSSNADSSYGLADERYAVRLSLLFQLLQPFVRWHDQSTRCHDDRLGRRTGSGRPFPQRSAQYGGSAGCHGSLVNHVLVLLSRRGGAEQV